ncbi:box C/D snoRNA protein 1 isoform X2 [Ochotona curzoniae]|uniref:box C/D snoRNA protein 1 isoform X2 n=1 Tax=Ochotona curzoniae TaxID=130825 RepID=UPI001B3495B5|nr:box C/D snoRNA protein 1 isoform X2 [Ochotona curzoniae]
MESAAESEGTLERGVQRVAEGTRPCPESGGERDGDLTGMPELDGLTSRKTEAGERARVPKAEEMRMDLAVVKRLSMDGSGGPYVTPEADGGPEMRDEKVKEEVDWPDVKGEQEDQVELKQQVFPGRSLKEEGAVEGEQVKDDQAVLKKQVVDDSKVEEEPQVNPRVGCKRKLAMSRCETCGTEEAKYRCPRCLRYSCSLPCVKKHKAELTCNGVRNKTAYVSIQQFTEMNLLSDYRFLEDVARTADHISRDTFLKRPISNKHMYFMKNRARRQGINLKLLPNGFTKRKENSTFFDKKKQQFCWHVKLCFPQCQAEYIEKRVPDDKTINDILKTYIDPEKSDPVIRQRLKAYIHSQNGVQVLMKVENMQQNLVRYYELDLHKSLLDNLRNKVIIEYPTFHVVLKGSSNDMKILQQVKSESTKNFGKEKLNSLSGRN